MKNHQKFLLTSGLFLLVFIFVISLIKQEERHKVKTLTKPKIESKSKKVEEEREVKKVEIDEEIKASKKKEVKTIKKEKKLHKETADEKKKNTERKVAIENKVVVREENEDGGQTGIVQEEVKVDEIRTETIVVTKTIPYKIIDNYAEKSSESKVVQAGVEGVELLYYLVTYRNGIEESRILESREVRQKPVDEVIARYVKVQDKLVETQEVDDFDKPIYETSYKDRWFVRAFDGSVFEYFYSSDEAFDFYSNLLLEKPCHWGDAEAEVIETLIGYEKKTVDKVVQEEVWEWCK